MRRINLTGRRFGSWVVLAFDRCDSNNRGCLWRCRCDCGIEFSVMGTRLLRGRSSACKSCITHARNLRRCQPGQAAMRSVLNHYQDSARKRGFVWELTEEEFHNLTSQNCFYCGAEPFTTTKSYSSPGRRGHAVHNGEYTFNGLDRIDSLRGYAINNTVPCCKICNYAKRQMSPQEFLAWISRVYLHNHQEINAKSLELF